MPRISDVMKRMPEHKEYFDPMSASFVPIRDWFEPYASTAKLRVWEDTRGNRRVAIVKLLQGEAPPRIAGPAPDEYISWDEAWRRLQDIAKNKSEAMAGMKWTQEQYAIDENEGTKLKREWGWKPKKVA